MTTAVLNIEDTLRGIVPINVATKRTSFVHEGRKNRIVLTAGLPSQNVQIELTPPEALALWRKLGRAARYFGQPTHHPVTVGMITQSKGTQTSSRKKIVTLTINNHTFYMSRPKAHKLIHDLTALLENQEA